ncbi:MAG: prealbumin-like fold domain-containing protein [Ruminococcus sp.]
MYQGYSYTVTEIEAPKGYSLNSEPQTVKIATDTADFGTEMYPLRTHLGQHLSSSPRKTSAVSCCRTAVRDTYESKRQITTGITDENGIATFSAWLQASISTTRLQHLKSTID